MLFQTLRLLAHEVYVLKPSEIKSAIELPSPNPFSSLTTNGALFLFCALATIVLVSIIFLISVSRKIEKRYDPFLYKIKHYAPFIGRVTIGISLMSAAFAHSLFGQEISLRELFGNYETGAELLLFLAGGFFVFGLWTRLAAGVVLAFFILAIVHYNFYMLTYLTYLGEAVLMLFVGGHLVSVDRNMSSRKNKMKIHPHSSKGFLFMRVLFGISLLFSSFYAKFLHSNLALMTVSDYHLTNFFSFPPLFLVLSAFLVESLIGIFFIIGFEIRFTAIFFMVFLMLSLIYFGESVWPHFILIGTNLAIFSHGYDRYTLEGRFFKKYHREPVL